MSPKTIPLIVVSVVVGSIALIRPFHVPRFAFLRDALFFTAAVLLLVVVLKDGHLTIFESGGMVGLYLAYVAVVVGTAWWQRRKRIELDEEESPLSRTPSFRDDDIHRANLSLLRAVEFRDVVNSLRSQSPTPFTHTGDDYFGVLGHRRSISSPQEWPHFSPAAGLGASVNVASSLTPTVVDGRRRSASLHRPNSHRITPKPNLHLDIPQIALTTPSGQAAVPAETPLESRFRIRHHTRQVLWTLFPSLRSFRHKSVVGMFMAVVSVPAILALTLTLPVVDESGREGAIALPEGESEPLTHPEIGEELHHLVAGFSPHSPLARFNEADTAEESCFSKELTAAQAFFGPVVCAALIFSE